MSTKIGIDAEFTTTSARIDIKVIMTDAAMAQRWMSKNTRNRNVRTAIVQRYRTDMEAGRWTFAADPIRFDSDGNLIDGQHRLSALAETEGITLPLLVVRGLPEASQSVMDQGSRRTPGDQLALRGIKDANAIAAAVRQYLIWSSGLLFRDNKAVQSSVTTPLIEQWVDENSALLTDFQRIINIVRQNDAPPSVAGAAALRLLQISPESAVEFFTLLARGAGTEGHPIVTLDKRLQRMRREGLKMPHRDYLALFLLAWNAWRDGRIMGKFQRPRGGVWSEDNFPEPH